MIRKFSFFCVILASAFFLLNAAVEVYQLEMGCFVWPGCYGSTDITEAAPAFRKLYFREPFIGAKPLYDNLSLFLIVSLILSLSLILIATWRNKACRIRAFSCVLLWSLIQIPLPLWLDDRYTPAILTANYLLSLLLLGSVYSLYLVQAPNALIVKNSRLYILARLGLMALAITFFLGSWQTFNGAGLACLDFITCDGSYFPHADYLGAFNFTEAGYPEAQVRIALNWMHRISALLTFIVAAPLAILLFSSRLRWAGILLGLLLGLQIIAGVAIVQFRLLSAAVIAHDALSGLLLLNLLYICFYLRPSALVKQAVTQPVIAEPPVEVQPLIEPEESFFNRLKQGLGKTRNNLTGFLGKLATAKVDQELLEEIEASLLTADVGVQATQEILSDITKGLDHSQLHDAGALMQRLRDRLYEMISTCSQPLKIPEETKPFVILVVGVNGAGKTTTIGKLAKHWQNQGRSVMLAAGDTFRAAAIEQLQTWGERNQIPVIAQQSGADSASVIFDAVAAAKSRGVDILIADTAGRLQTKSNLMEELSKIKRIMQKHDINAPHEVLLVLDACTGQNALSQTKLFNDAVGLTGLALTKLDGTAKGGVIFALGKQFGIPIRYIGVGEGIDDLHEFDALEFIDALFAETA